MNVPLSDTIGLHIYRELMHREGRCAANWHVNYGPEALQKSPDPEAMVNLGLFSKFASVPMPLDVQRECSLTETVNARPCPNPLLSALTGPGVGLFLALAVLLAALGLLFGWSCNVQRSWWWASSRPARGA